VWPTLWAVNLFIVTPLPPSENETQLLGWRLVKAAGGFDHFPLLLRHTAL
jgi:hypothetical protein